LAGYLAFDGGGFDIVVRQEVGLVLWALVALGLALGILPRGRPQRLILIPLVGGAGLLLWMLLSLSWTESEERATAEIARLIVYLGIVSLALASLNRHTFRAAAAGLSVAAVVVSCVALLSRLYPDLVGGASSLLRTDRLNYPLDYWNGLAAWGAMTIAICLSWSAHARLGVTRALTLAAVPVAGLVIYLTYSRGGVAGVAVGVVSALILARNRWTVLAHALVAGAATSVVILVTRQHPQIAHASGDAGASTILGVLLAVAAAAVGSGQASAATVTVCPSGCAFTQIGPADGGGNAAFMDRGAPNKNGDFKFSGGNV